MSEWLISGWLALWAILGAWIGGRDYRENGPRDSVFSKFFE